MLHLLKQKSKVGIAHKGRRKYDALMPVKRLKTSAQQPPQQQQPAPQSAEEVKKDAKSKKIQPKVVEHYDTEMKK